MTVTEIDPRLWDARHFIYNYWAEHTHAPTVNETAQALGIDPAHAERLYHELDARHALLLMPGTTTIRIANPFSGVPTGFRVRVGEREYYANCAWDALGIPAALHADAVIEAVLAHVQEPVRLTVKDRMVSGEHLIAHFLQPFARWYDDLVFT